MLMHILLAEWFCCVPPAPYVNNSSSWPSVILWSHYSSHIYMGFMPEDWLHHNICVPCAVQWNLMWPLNVEISCNDISFNFSYIIFVMYGTSPISMCRMKLT